MLILIIVLVLFGAKKLPELARSLGQSMNEFRKAREDFDRELQSAGKDLNTKPQNTQPYQAPISQASVPVQPAAPPVQTPPPQPAQTQAPEQTHVPGQQV
jgi:TatA/E family protein of Tat protein translocase